MWNVIKNAFTGPKVQRCGRVIEMNGRVSPSNSFKNIVKN